MAQEGYTLTRSGYEKLQLELEDLEKRLSREIEDVADVHSDVRFDEEGAMVDAQTTKDYLQERVNHIKLVLQTAEIIDEDPDPDRVSPGDRVMVWDADNEEELTFDLIGGEEIILGRKGISIDSPVGQALLNHKIGDKVTVTTPDGKARYEIRSMGDIPNEE
jgi:transcription elongation factor GreA